MAYEGRRVFKHGPTTTVVMVATTALFAAITVVSYAARGWNMVTMGMGVAILVGVAAIVESRVARIEITDDALVVTDLRGRKSYAVGDIERIEETKGGPAAILMKAGHWVKLPSVGSNVGNSVRAWLKAQ
ncbi:MAG TPA: hypothetical protein VJR92_08765 [Gemmatimonadaceae bacterium]|nr:hypothetical protein [Gemmatimonadaceae bacterium]